MTAPIMRLGRHSDLDFIEDSWLTSYRYGFIKFFDPSIEPLIYEWGHRQLIRQILTRQHLAVAVAHAPDYDEAIISYIVAEPKVLHYAYTKTACRNHGIVRDLLSYVGITENGLQCSHLTKIGKSILRKKPAIRYNPWLLVTNHNHQSQGVESDATRDIRPYYNS